MRLFRFAFVLWSTVGLLAAADNRLDAVFARIDKAAAVFKGLKADLKMTAYTAVISETSIQSGTVVVKSPKPHDLKMLVNFTEPEPRKVRLEGNKLEVFNPKANVLQVYDLSGKHKAVVEQFFRLAFGTSSRDLKEGYTVSYGAPETLSGKATQRIELIPKSKDLLAMYPKFELWVADDTGIALQQKMYQPGGDYSMLTYSNMEINPNLPDSALNPNLPKGYATEHPLGSGK